MNLAEQLARLAELRDKGILSPSEFEREKDLLLARSAAALSNIGAYAISELVGEGGMGKVYRGRHRTEAMATRQGGDVAIKVLHAHLASRPGIAERFRNEAEALAALEHPNIVKVHDVIEDAGQVALVMEWVPGRPLSELIGSETGPIPWDRARTYVDPLLDAVQHAHDRKVIHRDLKPDNIRVMPDGTIKVLDFGIARMGAASGPTKTGTGFGTVAYMAPEQYTDAKGVDERADVYALGMTLYEMVAGRLPWAQTETEFSVLQQKHSGQIRPPTDFYPAIPPWVVDALMSALSPDPDHRPPSVDALRIALRTENAPTLVTPKSGAPKSVPPNAAPRRSSPPRSAPPPPPTVPDTPRPERPAPPPARSNRWIAALMVSGLGLAALLYLALVPVKIRAVADPTTATPDEPVYVETLGISTLGFQREISTATLSASPADKVAISGNEVRATGSGNVSITAAYGSLESTVEIYASTPVSMEVELDGKKLVGGTVELVRGRPMVMLVRTVDGEGRRSEVLDASAVEITHDTHISVELAPDGGRQVPALQAAGDGRSSITVEAKGQRFEFRVWARVPASLSLAKEIRVPRQGTAPVGATLVDATGNAIGDALPDGELTATIDDESVVAFSATEPAGLAWKGAGTTRATFAWRDLRSTTTVRGLNATETMVLTCVGPPVDASACSTVGNRYGDGYADDGIAQSNYYAAKYLGLACRHGQTGECSNASYFAGKASDHCNAKEYAEIGCNSGDAHACGNLGTHYGNEGRCAYIDYDRAAALYRKACNGGEDWFCGNLYILAKNKRVELLYSESLSDLRHRGCTKAKNQNACN